MRLSEFFQLGGEVLLEDSRGNIKKFLGMSDELANAFHEASPKFAFALAKAYVAWLKAEHVVNYGGVNDPAQVARRGDDTVKQNLTRLDRNTFSSFQQEMGAPILAMLNDKPHYEKEINKANTSEEIAQIIAKYKKKKGEGSAEEDKRFAMRWPDGWYVFGPLSQEECRVEGSSMQHCASDHRGDLYSIRDPHGNPHVTMTWNRQKNAVYQIKGKQNKAPERKYWDRLIDFWEKYKPKLRDTEFSSAGGRVGKEVQELADQLNRYGNDEVIRQLNEQILPIINEPTFRRWLWDLDIILHNVSTWGDDGDAHGTLGVAKTWLTDQGFSKFTIKINNTTHDVFFDEGNWSEPIQNVPPWEQVKSLNGWMVVQLMSERGSTNNEVSKDVNAWVEQNIGELDKFYPAMNDVLALTNKHKPVRVRLLNQKSLPKFISPEQYADMFDLTRPSTENEWTSFDEFAAANPNIKVGIDKHLARYREYGAVTKKWEKIVASIQKIEKDTVGRVYVHTGEGVRYEVKPVDEAGSEYYFAIVKTK
jgi:hypothetical protein